MIAQAVDNDNGNKPASLEDEELWLALEHGSGVVVVFLQQVFGRHFATILSVNQIPLVSVRQDDDNAHVTLSMILELGKGVESPHHCLVIQIVSQSWRYSSPGQLCPWTCLELNEHLDI